ncbi:glycosyltransferase [Patescibacteria group bacterium]
MRLSNLLVTIVIVFITLASFLRLSWVESFIFALSLGLFFQGALASFSMLYSFLRPESLQKVLPPRVVYGGGYYKYSLIVPARNEEKVIGDTIKAMAKINYPKDLYEVLVVIRKDDQETLTAAKKAMDELNVDSVLSKADIKIIKINGDTISKPHSLNMSLNYATGQVIAVFDAEDEPHKDILKSVDDVFLKKKVDIVQAGVQLINVSSRWFSALNCLEYYYWFKSILPFMSNLGSTPLGGNTVFFRKDVLQALGGWDESCLTEDADVGIRASVAGYKTAMVYVEDMATLEETPQDEWAFIKQRTRWDQGYLQILLKGNFLKLPTLRQQFLSLYLLTQPIIHQFTVIAMIFIPILSWGLKVPLWLAMFSWFPFYFLLVQFGLYIIGLMDLKKHYSLSFSNSLFFYLPVFFIPYQLMLAFSFFRAVLRMFLGVFNWEKTYHANTHRLASKPVLNK